MSVDPIFECGGSRLSVGPVVQSYVFVASDCSCCFVAFNLKAVAFKAACD